MCPALVAACQGLAADLTAAGVPASVERGKVQTPGAWVAPQQVDITTLAGGGTVTVDVVLVVGDHGDLPVLAALDGLLDKVLTLDLPFTAPVDTSYALALPDRSPLPAFRVPVEIDL
jgi:hypothetical protein